MMVAIYALIDPRINECRYVGKTINELPVRLGKHLGDKRPSRRRAWLTHLLNAGVKPSIICLEHAPIADQDDAEIFWIAYMKSLGANLVNGTLGGDGGVMTPEAKKKHAEKAASAEVRAAISISSKRAWADPKHKARVSKAISEARMNNPEMRRRHSEFMRELGGRPEVHDKKSRQSTEWQNDPQVKMEISQRSTAMWQRDGFKQKESAARKIRCSDPTYKRKVSIMLQEINARPEVRALKSTKNKEVWSDPEYKKKMCKIRSEQNNRPDVLDKNRATTKALWQNPEYVAKVMTARKVAAERRKSI